MRVHARAFPRPVEERPRGQRKRAYRRMTLELDEDHAAMLSELQERLGGVPMAHAIHDAIRQTHAYETSRQRVVIDVPKGATADALIRAIEAIAERNDGR